MVEVQIERDQSALVGLGALVGGAAGGYVATDWTADYFKTNDASLKRVGVKLGVALLVLGLAGATKDMSPMITTALFAAGAGAGVSAVLETKSWWDENSII